MSSRKYKFWLILKIIHNKPKICNAHVPTCVFHLLVCISNPDCWVCLPLVILLNTIKSRKIFLLALARPGGPGKRAVKWVVWWCMCLLSSSLLSSTLFTSLHYTYHVVNIEWHSFFRSDLAH